MLKAVRLLKSSTPSWSGFMQSVEEGDFPGRSSFKFLPMIDLNPGDLSCIYSTLHFVYEEARKYQTTPIVTFDQPLYWMASSIVQSESKDSPLKNAVLRLGGFHMQMSFLGSIGHLMQATGLHDVLETVYASNAVEHMMSGKAVSRAVRGHLLVDSALNMILTSEAYGVLLPIEQSQTYDERAETTNLAADANESKLMTVIRLTEQQHTRTSEENKHMNEDQERTTSVDEIENYIERSDTQITDFPLSIENDMETLSLLYDKLTNKEVSSDFVSKHPVFQNVEVKFDAKQEELRQYPTSCLWIQYMEMVDILRRFIKAERTGNWHLHLQTVEDMLPYLAASGHNQSVKSAYLYLQQMNELQDTHPDVYAKFANGHHVVRRSERYWAGLSTDLTIEQTLKSTGGMTRGKGMTEVQRAQWLLSMSVCAAVNSSIQSLTQTSYQTSEQHKESTRSRQARDHTDLMTILQFLTERKPFEAGQSLRNIENGVIILLSRLKVKMSSATFLKKESGELRFWGLQ